MKRKEERGFSAAFCFVSGCLFSIIFSSTGIAASNLPNPNQQTEQVVFTLAQSSQALSFNPNQYSFLIYDPHDSSSSDIQIAMTALGISNYDVRSKDNPVTALDLSTHSILIVGWNDSGNMSGLHKDIIKTGIIGRVLLTGQDADHHATSLPAAKTFLSQAIAYVLNDSGTGLLALGDFSEGFQWLPDNWGITTTYGLTKDLIQSFTEEGLASGVFDGLKPNDIDSTISMSCWGYSYHNTFDSYGIGFVPFELGTPNTDTVVIAAQDNPIGLSFIKTDDVADGDCRSPGQEITYTIRWSNPTSQTFTDVSIVDFLPAGVTVVEESLTAPPPSPAPAEPNIIFGIKDANDLAEITLPVGQSVRLYLTKETFEENIFSFSLEVNTSDPNLGWIDNTEYDPNNPGTAEILAQPREPSFDYYGPGSTQEEGIQFFAANFNNPINDGDLASFVYTATEPGYVTLTLVNYDTNSATLEEIVIHQVDPNDPYEPNIPSEPPSYPAASPAGFYDEQAHTITWPLDDIEPGDSNSVSFQVIVNYKAEPGMNLHNVAELYTGQTLVVRKPLDTPVCCWDTGHIIYVDKTANGNNNGTNWTDAYTDLQNALYRAEKSTCQDVNTIYVAQGEYSPGTRVIDSFVLPDGVSVYGGFMSKGCDFDRRNPKLYITTLTGYIDPNNSNETIVVMGDETLLNGVVVRDSDVQGILGDSVTCSIFDCQITKNKQFGVLAENSNVELKWCIVDNNKYDGIRHFDGETSLTVENSQIIRNGQHGIYDANSVPTIKNSVICGNGSENISYFGVRIWNPCTPPVLHNNTIAYNYNAAIAYSNDNDPNYVNQPDIQNCIIWYNNDNGEQFAGYKPAWHFSCIYDPNDFEGVSETVDGNHNFSHKPDFAYENEPNNVHLQYDSFCKNKGNPNLPYANQNDIDGEIRVADEAVDVGADEISCDNVYNALDWNADGLVNLYEFNFFARAWLSRDPDDPALSDPNDAIGWDPNCNFVATETSQYIIDLADLLAFIGQYSDTDHWLWTACWRHDIQDMQQQTQQLMMMSNSLIAESTSMLQSETAVKQPAEPVLMQAKTLPFQKAETESVAAEEVDPVAEREQVLSLLESIESLIDAGGDDAEIWREVKNLLEQSLVETEDIANETTEF